MIAARKKLVSTPWGVSDYGGREVAPGITKHSTPSHGGYHLSPERMARLRHKFPGFKTFAGGPWFEEDCDWAIVCLAFPEAFPAEALPHAETTIRNAHPEVWEAHTGRQLLHGESRRRDQERFNVEHSQDLVTVSAIGHPVSGKPHVLPGMVEVTASIGGRRERINEPGGTRRFLVPLDVYRAGRESSPFGWVVDPSQYEEVACG